jgi:hypothetical protein
MAIVVVAVAVLVGLHYFTHQAGTQRRLAEISCRKLRATSFELQGHPILTNTDETCELTRMIAGMTPLADEYHSDPRDPWHYFGRLRILPEDDAWFLIFMAKSSENYRPVFALLHRNGPGWSVIGLFDAAPLLSRLGVTDRIDWDRVRSSESLAPGGESTVM